MIVALPGVTQITGGGGDDKIYASHAVVSVEGGDGNDQIFGEIPVSLETGATAAASSAIPGATFDGGAGNDLIYATPWVLTINGGGGDDLLYGEIPTSLTGRPSTSPPPIPQGGAVSSSAVATASSVCTPTPPITYCGVGDQTFSGQTGNDVAFGQRGNDTLYGNEGDDQLFGGIGDDPLISGGIGDDLVSGGMGYDANVNGNDGSDLVRGDGTIDGMQDSGATGTDTVSFATGITPGFQTNVTDPFTGLPILGFPAPGSPERGVYVDLRPNNHQADNGVARYGGGNDTSTFNPAGFEDVVGTPFPDYIIGSDGPNRIDGGGGADAIFGMGGADVIYGGADGDHLDGNTGASDTLIGDGGSDWCWTGTAVCERSYLNDPTGKVIPRVNANQISVGYMAINGTSFRYVDLYLVGSATTRDNVTVGYSTDGSGTGHVTFTAEADSATFNLADEARTYLCNYNSSTQVVCDLPRQLSSINLAGIGGDDHFYVNSFPVTTSVVELGGEGGDYLEGSQFGSAPFTEDMLVDGTDSRGDTLQGYAGDDALVNNEGTDGIYGGDGNDLFVSASICNGDTIGGGPGENNASWAQMPGTKVVADLAAGTAGDQSGPSCSSGGLATLSSIVDLEGSDQYDGLLGDGGNNQLFGRPGQDSLYGRDGEDTVLAHLDAQADTVNCGLPDPPGNDTAHRDDGDTTTGCETVVSH